MKKKLEELLKQERMEVENIRKEKSEQLTQEMNLYKTETGEKVKTMEEQAEKLESNPDKNQRGSQKNLELSKGIREKKPRLNKRNKKSAQGKWGKWNKENKWGSEENGNRREEREVTKNHGRTGKVCDENM